MKKLLPLIIMMMLTLCLSAQDYESKIGLNCPFCKVNLGNYCIQYNKIIEAYKNKDLIDFKCVYCKKVFFIQKTDFHPILNAITGKEIN